MVELTITVRELPIHVVMNGDAQLPTIVFLHGFTGATTTWREVLEHVGSEFRTIAVDLTGHGMTGVPEAPARYAMEEQIADLHMLFQKLSLQSFVLVGYSMGGRIALAYTIQYPEQIQALVLESASPGLATEEARIARRQADEKLACRIEAEGVRPFVDNWENIPLFQSQKKLPEEKRIQIRNERLQQSGQGLANSLRGIGTGSQPSYWGLIGNLKENVLLITGELDEKFVTIAREMNEIASLWKHTIVPGAGHAIHVEKPSLFATMVKEFILAIQKEEH
ncbi:2-succinyl-6-hydroxy-2,4-cyclohexadiene-1-carboxylate synthase [Sporosarcina sp. OR05]|uniref:2-succinyl-6-hydroxy-2, 4-cyclohexadiene-1-carboxylate synthase n=1 Tax=Sporosarcina sp. OR05 TaxID=2969819 RepID=UPI00352B6842